MTNDHARDLQAPVVQPERGWVPVMPFPSIGTSRSFVSGEPDGRRLRVAYFRREHDNALMAKVWFGPGAEGPPGYAHGGSVAAVLDEAMGGAAWMSGLSVVAARLAIDFRRLVPLGTDATLEAWVHQVEGRKVTTRGRLMSASADPFAEAEALFVTLLPEQAEELRARMQGS